MKATRRVAELLPKDWEQDLKGALQLLASPPGRRPVCLTFPGVILEIAAAAPDRAQMSNRRSLPGASLAAETGAT